VYLLLQIWIQPEQPKKLTAIFSNLTDVVLWCVFPECDLNWTLFILESAPALQFFLVSSVTSPCSLIQILTWIPLILVCHVCGYSALTTYQQVDLILTYSNLSQILQVVLIGHICHWDVGNT
jgi:hypothetical protein